MTMERLGLGLAALGRPGYMTLGHGGDLGETSVEAMERRCHELLDAALAAGVRNVDAARSYGRSEEFLASWLASRKIEPGALTISSKWGYTYTAGWRADAARHEVKDHSVAALRRQLAESRTLLGPYLDIYQIHSVTPESPVLTDAEVLGELGRLRDAGVLVGLSLSGPRQAEVLEQALRVRAGGSLLFGSVQATWNLLERSSGEMLARAHAAGLRVMIKEGLANGRLARETPPLLAEVARALSATPDAVALAAILAQPWADVVLSGAATLDQLGQNLRAAALRLDPGALAELEPLEEAPAQYWAHRAKLAWT